MQSFLVSLFAALTISFGLHFFDKIWEIIENSKIFNDIACFRNYHKINLFSERLYFRAKDYINHDHFVCEHCKERILFGSLN